MFRVLLRAFALLMLGASLGAASILVLRTADSSNPDDSENISVELDVVAESRSIAIPVRVLVSTGSIPLYAGSIGTLTEIYAERHDASDADQVWGAVNNRSQVFARSELDGFFHRRLALGSKGPDVELLQQFLGSRGTLAGKPDSVFGLDTQLALNKYWTMLGMPARDDLHPGDLVFVDPTNLVLLRSELAIGQPMNESIVVADSSTPQLLFTANVPINQSRQISIGDLVRAEGFTGKVVAQGHDPVIVQELPIFQFSIEPIDVERQFVAGESFAATVSSDAPLALWVPPVAVATDAYGDPFVTLADGSERAVTLGQELGGLIEVSSGLEAHDTVVVPNPALEVSASD